MDNNKTLKIDLDYLLSTLSQEDVNELLKELEEQEKKESDNDKISISE